MRNIRAFLVFVIFLVVLVQAKAEDPLTVMSYNIRYGTAEDGENSWDRRKSATLSLIRFSNPDICGLQEAFSFQISYILDNCKWLGVFGKSRLGDLKDSEHPAVLYNKRKFKLLDSGNFWLSETPDTVSFGWDAACERNVSWGLMERKKDKKLFWCVNTHLDHVGKEARVKGLEVIFNFINNVNADGYPVVLTGDFNVEVNDEAIKVLDGIMLNARYSSSGSTDNYGTFNGWGSCDTSIDYIFYSGFSDCLQYMTIRKNFGKVKYISDHYPIMAKLGF